MLWKIMEVKGRIPNKTIKSGQFWKQHFDEKELAFMRTHADAATGQDVVKYETDLSVKRDLEGLLMNRLGPERRKSDKPEDQLYVRKCKQFADLLHKMTALDPEKRLNPVDALKHPFVAEAWEVRGPPRKQQ